MVVQLTKKDYQEREAFQPNVEYATALGKVVPIDDIHPQYILASDKFPWENWRHEDMGCKQKGDMAVTCVRAAIMANLFPLWVCGYVNHDKELDIQGTDIIVSAKRRIQVKYDHLAYPREEGGSGNLFVQTHECNPHKIH